MKRLQLPKNKFVLILVNIIFFFLWAKLIGFLISPLGTVGKFWWEIIWELDFFNNVEHRRIIKLIIFLVQWPGFISGSIYLWKRKPKKTKITRSKD